MTRHMGYISHTAVLFQIQFEFGELQNMWSGTTAVC